VLIGEDWNNVMYAYVRATNSLAIAFFMSLMILGNLVLLNLFLAILLKNFEEEVIIEDEEEEEEEAVVVGGKEGVCKRLKNKMARVCCRKKLQVAESVSQEEDMTTNMVQHAISQPTDVMGGMPHEMGDTQKMLISGTDRLEKELEEIHRSRSKD
jgi:predicted membrane protein